MTPDNSLPSLDEMRRLIGRFITEHPEGGTLWTIMTCLRGPDAPSETNMMDLSERSATYSARRKRKYETVEIIRQEAFFGKVGGVARHHKENHITLPPQEEWDHFDKHVAEAAALLGLKVVIKKNERKGVMVGRGQDDKESYKSVSAKPDTAWVGEECYVPNSSVKPVPHPFKKFITSPGSAPFKIKAKELKVKEGNKGEPVKDDISY